MQEKGCLTHSSETSKARFGEPPEAFYAVDMSLAPGKFIAAMIDSKVFAVTYINQTVIATPPIGIDDALRDNFTAYNGLQRGFGAIGNDLSINLSVPFEDTEDDGFTVCATTSFA